ncbi:PAS domain-containing protein [Hymenobacter algoricola]|uniref:histidine kinase n=1 Tax=Hymenobacter algoricola TaxID=486267 RepID=A0ABP7MF77_9BACT
MTPPSASAFLTPERIEAALDAAGVGVWEMELPSRSFTCSTRCKSLFNLLPDADVVFESLLAATHPQDRQRLQQEVENALDPHGNGRFALEHRVVLPNGPLRWVLSTGLAIFDEQRTRVLRFQGITKDISETYTRQHASQQQSAEFEFLAESVSEILWIAQADGAVTYFNQRWMQYTGLTLPQSLAWGWEAVIHPQDLARCLERWTIALQSGNKYEVEYRFRCSDGTYRWFIGRALPLRDEAGSILKWFGTCTDIHEQKQTEAMLRSREKELEQAYQDLEAKVTFRTLALEEQVRSQQRRIAELQQQADAR